MSGTTRITSALLIAGLGTTALAGRAQAQRAVPGGADSVQVHASVYEPGVAPGEALSIAVSLRHAKGFHTWPNDPVVPPQFEGLIPIATDIQAVSLPDGARVEAMEWPDPVPITVRYARETVDLLSYTETVVAHVRVRLSPEQPPGPASAILSVRYQACDEFVCYPPKSVKVTVGFRVEPRGDGNSQ